MQKKCMFFEAPERRIVFCKTCRERLIPQEILMEMVRQTLGFGFVFYYENNGKENFGD